ncbi:MAG: DUF167 domain-containing protein [Phycisphaerae bacterium]|nr:DUF167 domain-containing protein [Phycisphaerae bacterium]
MGERLLRITQQGTDILLDVKVVPKSSRDRIVGELEGALKVAVSAAPERGAANEAVCKLVAKTLGLRVQQVTVEAGHTSPRKTLRITGITAEAVRQALVP